MKKRQDLTSFYLFAMVALSVLIAMQIVLSRFLSIQAWNLKIGFAFVPVVVAAYLYGPVGGIAVAGIGDLLGAFLFPSGPFFPGFTLTAAFNGSVYGFCLKKNQSMMRIILAVGITQTFGSLLLNTYWISFTSGAPFMALLPTRLAQYILMCIVQVVVIRVLSTMLVPRLVALQSH